jgi:D-arabinonate dehydratase
MRITKIKAIPIRMPLNRIFPGSTYEIKVRSTIITEVHTDEGYIGRTYLGDNRDMQSQVYKLIVDLLGPLLIGDDPLFVERCWYKMFEKALTQGHRREVAEAVAVIDTAIWDLHGKICKQPVYKILGGYTDRLKPIVTGGYYAKDNDHTELVEEKLQTKEKGFAGTKIKVGGLSP